MSWLPIYLAETFGFDIKQIGLFAWVPYVGAMIGSLGGGWLSGRLIGAGWAVDLARKRGHHPGRGDHDAPACCWRGAGHRPAVGGGDIAVVLFGFQIAIGNIQTLPGDISAAGRWGRWRAWAAWPRWPAR